MTEQSPIRPVPLAQLAIHEFNPRQDHDDLDIAALAMSIEINGLMQNLMVFDDGGALGVVAGGRRLLALQKLRQGGRSRPDGQRVDFDAVPCRVTSDPMLARSWAGTESATQKPLHQADEVRAYRAMADQGSSVNMIARAFAQTESHVNRRLRLANLPEPALAALRENRISLDVAKVLTLCETGDQTERMLDLAQSHRQGGADWLRRQIIGAKVPSSDRRVIFVGLPAYLDAGGRMEDDLFADQTLLHDADLVARLFTDHLKARAARVADAEGWGQVVPVFETYLSYTHHEKMDRLRRPNVDLPAADQAELDNLNERMEQELSEADMARMEELEARQIGDFRDEDRAAATLFIYVDREGAVNQEGPYLPRAARPDGASGEDAAPVATAKPPISQTGLDDLHRVNLLALQTKLLAQPELALDLLAFQVAGGFYSYNGPFNLKLDPQPATPSEADETRIDARLTEDPDPREDGPAPEPAAAFMAFRAKGKKHRNHVLTCMLARAMNDPRSARLNAAVAAQLGAGARQVWTPTAKNHFRHYSVLALDRLWQELWHTLCGDDADPQVVQSFTTLKKGAKAEALGALFSDASVQEAHKLGRDQIAMLDEWLPVPLRAAP